jgi:hypothetical protein
VNYFCLGVDLFSRNIDCAADQTLNFIANIVFFDDFGDALLAFLSVQIKVI